jgi:MOSC domain-containing protein YiiM
MQEPHILSINTKPDGGIYKRMRPEGAVLEQFGFRGDHHNREMRPSFSKPGTMKPNTDRHVTLLAMEVIDELNLDLDLQMIPGSLGENITTVGLGDLSNIKDGSLLIIRNWAIGTELARLRVIEQNAPCKNLAPIHRLLVKKIHGRRGIACAIESGVGHRLIFRDRIEVAS